MEQPTSAETAAMRCKSICRIARGADKCKIGVMWMNHEGYRDPTADRAVRKADKMPKHIRKIFDALNTVVSVEGIKVTEITVKHTGRKWKL